MTPRTISFALLSLALALGCSGKKDGDKNKAGTGKTAPKTPDTKPTAGNDGNQNKPKKPVTPPPPATYKDLAKDPGGAEGKALWVNRVGGQLADVARGVAIDKDGNVALTGHISDGADFGDGTPVEVRKKDAYVSKYSPDGKLAWSKTFGGAGEEGGYSVAFDGSGNLVVVGLFAQEMSIGDIKLVSQGSDDVFFAKFAADGTLMWAHIFGGSDSDVAYDVAMRPNGHVLVTGSFKGAVKTPDGELKSKGNQDVFVLELDADGGLMWVKQFGERYKDYGHAIAVDDAGHLLILGEFAGETSFGGAKLTPVGNHDLYLVKLTPSGEHVWSKQFGGAFNELGMSVATDPAGNVAITGSFTNRIQFADDMHSSQGESDVFVAKFTSNGEHLWSRSFGSAREDVGQGLDMDQYGNVVFGGFFWNTMDMGGASLTANGANRDGFVAKLSADGKHVWSQRLGDKDHDRLRSVAVGKDGKVAVAGVFRFGLDIGTGVVQSARKPDEKAPFADAFVALYDR